MTTSIPVYRIEERELEGHPILAIDGASNAALPNTGRRNARYWTAFNLKTRMPLCQIHKSEVRQWLVQSAKGEDLPTNDIVTL